MVAYDAKAFDDSDSYARIDVRRLAGAVGAEIHGIDLAQDQDDETIAEIRRALHAHCVVFFRDQDITPAQHLGFARRFGPVIEYPMVKGLDGFPEIAPVVKLPDEVHNFGGIWHADTTYLQTPPLGAILVARELPPYGGDTEFANMQLAYEALSDGMKAMLGRLHVVNSSAKAEVTTSREDRLADAGTDTGRRNALVAEHPAVMAHPETGRKALFMNYGHTVRFKELTEAESKPILEHLYRHQTRPEFTCRFIWRPGSIAFWDNWSCQHNPINDYHGFKRVMHRVTVAREA